MSFNLEDVQTLYMEIVYLLFLVLFTGLFQYIQHVQYWLFHVTDCNYFWPNSRDCPSFLLNTAVSLHWTLFGNETWRLSPMLGKVSLLFLQRTAAERHKIIKYWMILKYYEGSKVIADTIPKSGSFWSSGVRSCLCTSPLRLKKCIWITNTSGWWRQMCYVTFGLS